MAMFNCGLFEINNQNLNQCIDTQIKASKMILGLAMKYNAKKDERILHRLANLISEFGQIEKNIASNIIELC